MDARAVLADVAGLGPYFALDTGPLDPAAGWRPLADLLRGPGPHGPLGSRIDQVRRALRSDARVAASIAFQGLAAQLVSAPFAAVTLHGQLPELTARTLFWRPAQAGPWPLAVPDPVGAPGGGPALAALLLDGLLAPLVGALRAQVSIAERLLWGNVASALAGAKRMLVEARPAAAERAAALAAELLAGDRLAGAGELLAPIGPDRVWSFRRRSCCLYYRVDGGGLCADCVLTGRDPAGSPRSSR